MKKGRTKHQCLKCKSNLFPTYINENQKWNNIGLFCKKCKQLYKIRIEKFHVT